MVNRRKFLGLVGLSLISGSASAITIGDSGGRIKLEPTSAVYKTKEGDTLSAISKRFYGTSEGWQEIYAQNQKVIGSDPNKVRMGLDLEIDYDRALTYFESQFEELPKKNPPVGMRILEI